MPDTAPVHAGRRRCPHRALRARWRRLTHASAFVFALFAITASGLQAATGAAFDEYQVKAVFLYNFARFVQWPVNEETLVIGVLGDASLARRVEQAVNGKPLNGRRVVVRRLQTLDDAERCQILFISASELRRTPEVLKRVEGLAILTVGDTTPFLRDGGMIRFFVEGNRIRFQINAAAVEKVGLKISSQVLTLAAP